MLRWREHHPFSAQAPIHHSTSYLLPAEDVLAIWEVMLIKIACITTYHRHWYVKQRKHELWMKEAFGVFVCGWFNLCLKHNLLHNRDGSKQSLSYIPTDMERVHCSSICTCKWRLQCILLDLPPITRIFELPHQAKATPCHTMGWTCNVSVMWPSSCIWWEDEWNPGTSIT